MSKQINRTFRMPGSRKTNAVRVPEPAYQKFIKESAIAGQALGDFFGSLLAGWDALSLMQRAKCMRRAGEWRSQEKRQLEQEKESIIDG